MQSRGRLPSEQSESRSRDRDCWCGRGADITLLEKKTSDPTLARPLQYLPQKESLNMSSSLRGVVVAVCLMAMGSTGNTAVNRTDHPSTESSSNPTENG